MPHPDDWHSDVPVPATVAQAVLILADRIPEQELRRIAQLQKDELCDLHFGIGAWNRHFFGLRDGNAALLNDAGGGNAYGASDAIILALWKNLQGLPSKSQ